MDWTSHTMERIPESGTLKMFDMARRLEQEGKKIYHFEVGQPDFPTPEHIVNAGIEALKEGFTRYTPARGIPPILDAQLVRYLSSYLLLGHAFSDMYFYNFGYIWHLAFLTKLFLGLLKL